MEFEKLLKELGEQRAALTAKITNAATNEELDQIALDLRKVDMKIASLQNQMQAAGITENGEQGDPAERNDSTGNPEQRTAGGFNPIASYRSNGMKDEQEEEDVFGSLEYRKAFQRYITEGTPIPEKFNVSKRTAQMTVVGDVAAVIPTNIQAKVIEDITVEGKILEKVTQTQLQGGIEYPIADIMPEATWLSSEEEVSEEQKAKMDAKLIFSYHMLEAKISLGLLTATVSLPVFEATITRNIKKAIIRAIEKAIVAGSGNGKPLGFTKYSLPADQKVGFNNASIGTVKGWARAEAAIPEEYEENDIYIMSKKTWELHLNAMTDTTGQKIGLGKINEKGQKILNGRQVITTDRLPSYDSAQAGETFAVLINLEEYLLNSNLALYYKRYLDEDKNKVVHKALTIVDGKMAIGTVMKDGVPKLVGAKGLIYLQKEAKETTLSALTIGSLTLSPVFSSDKLNYTASTTASTNTITATPKENDSTVEIKVGDDTVKSGSAATWENGANTVTITVTNGVNSTTYTVTVTKTAE